MSTVKNCCSRHSLYNLRRYDPLGRTMWIRDYFFGATGQHTDAFSSPCRVAVHSAQERIFVSGPLAWTDPNNERSWWNLACYTTSGQLLWRTRIGGETAGGATDVVVANGKYYVIINQDELGFLSLVEFDINGNTLHSATTSFAQQFGPRMLVANPSQHYQLPAFEGLNTGPPGITTFGWPGIGIAISAAYFPTTDDFVIGVPPPNTGAVFDIVWRSNANAEIMGGNGLITSAWPFDSWGIQNTPFDLFAGPEQRIWIIPDEMSPAANGDVFCAGHAADFKLYQLTPTGDVTVTTLGRGSVVRLDGNTGSPVWMRGIASAHCITSDDDGRLYAGTLSNPPDHPSIHRWSQDGEFIWGHRHNRINQVAIVDDRGIVTVGNRTTYGVGEQNWIIEGSTTT
ncbi:MAG: hypothetical protein U0941_30065 [Planctomycetaceae bacterium]